jgi:hypothetical protein
MFLNRLRKVMKMFSEKIFEIRKGNLVKNISVTFTALIWNDLVEFLTLLLRIPEVPGSNLDQKTSYRG